ncbi:MAG: RagB/SusD family nutrient uptake outer membrane protein [Tidjanibacter sp.]|nr:RagB/SusD family nutrient uptake outer membrane protein [Tidjanibacter sp.]
MKKIVIIIAISLAALSLGSCKEWLEATSSTKIPASQLFETREGFEDALSGVYINMGSYGLYGRDLTWGYLDACVSPYNYSIAVNIKAFQNHLYNGVSAKLAIAEIWAQAYNMLANINLALRELESHRDVIFDTDEYNLYHGELLALRAYIHFDLLRIFGISNWQGDNASKLTVPYVLEYSSAVTPQKSYAETATLLWNDINSAIEALKASDPLLMTAERKSSFDNTINIDGFWNNRYFHLNYYAVLALAARVSQWQNDNVAAAQYAQQVIDGAFDSLVQWIDVEAQSTAVSDDNRDWIFSAEHIFSLGITNLYTMMSSSGWLMDTSGQKSGFSLPNSVVDNVLFVRNDPVTGSQAGAEDLRGPAMQLRIGGLGYYTFKYYGSSSYYPQYANRIPMIRISEMYYMLAEDLIEREQPAKALEQLDIVRRNRGISDDLPATADAPTELMKEYYREFISEGQLFYYLKHKQVTSSISPDFKITYTDLIFPYPDEELNYGRKQEL